MLDRFCERLIKLIDVKSIITFGIIGTLCILAIRQNVGISSEMFAATVTAIITYFFTRPKDAKVIEQLPIVKESQEIKE